MPRQLYKIITSFVFLFSLLQLSGCETVGTTSPEKAATKIPGAIPKDEPLSKSGNQNYVINGHKYYVLNSSKGYHKTGDASWYGAQFHGRRTSNRERFNLNGMTAASKELPLPTYIKVKNLENGKEVIVKVNDRGPFVGDRILDLSYAAAKQLGFTGQGVTKVDIVALDPKLYKQYAENMKRSTVKNGSAKRAKSSSTKSSVKSSKTKKSKKNHKIAQVA